MQTLMDEAFLQELEFDDLIGTLDEFDDLSDLEFRVESLEAEILRLEEQMLDEKRDFENQQKILAEIEKERANLGRNYRVNWKKEGF